MVLSGRLMLNTTSTLSFLRSEAFLGPLWIADDAKYKLGGPVGGLACWWQCTYPNSLGLWR